MTRAFQALTAEPWAIEPSWLPLMARIALRGETTGLPHAEEEWQKRDYGLMAGPGAARVPNSYRLFVDGGVGIIPITGPIFPRANMMTEYSGACSVTSLINDYRLALESSDIGAVMLLMDTPGGAVSGINSFADMVAAGTKNKLTIAHVAGAAASAGYWIASSASEIHAERTAIVGSIGVVSAVPKQVEPDASGEMWFEIVSTNAPMKRPDPDTEEGRADIVATLDAIEKLFMADVARGRGVDIATVKANFGQGGIKVGSDAKAAGMIDKVQSQEATMAQLKRHAANQKRMAALRNK